MRWRRARSPVVSTSTTANRCVARGMSTSTGTSVTLRRGCRRVADPKSLVLRAPRALSGGAAQSVGGLVLVGGEVEVVAPQGDAALVDDEDAGHGDLEPGAVRLLEPVDALVHHEVALGDLAMHH